MDKMDENTQKHENQKPKTQKGVPFIEEAYTQRDSTQPNSPTITP